MKSMPVLAMLAVVGLCAGCSVNAGELKGESISFPTSAATTASGAGPADAPAASASPERSASASAADSAQTGAHTADPSLPAAKDAQSAQAPAQQADDGAPDAHAGQQATTAAPDKQTGSLQQAAPAQTGQDSAVAGVAASVRASKQADSEAVSDSVVQAYAQCLVARAWDSLGPTARADMAAGGSEDSWRLSEAEEDSLDAAKDHCEEATPGFD